MLHLVYQFKFQLCIAALLFSGYAKAGVDIQGCNEQSPDTFRIGAKLLFIEPCSKDKFDNLPSIYYTDEEEKTIAKDPSLVQRRGDSLFLKAGKTVVLISNDTLRGYMEPPLFVYMGLLADSAFYLISVEGWEFSGCMLVSREPGEQFYLAGMPVFSPDRHSIVCSNYFIDSFDDAGLELFQIRSDKLIKTGELKPKKWAPREIKWIDNSTFVMKIAVDMSISVPAEYRICKIK